MCKGPETGQSRTGLGEIVKDFKIGKNNYWALCLTHPAWLSVPFVTFDLLYNYCKLQKTESDADVSCP